MTDGSPLGHRLFVVLTGGGFLSHPGWVVGQPDSKLIFTRVKKYALTFSLQ